MRYRTRWSALLCLVAKRPSFCARLAEISWVALACLSNVVMPWIWSPPTVTLPDEYIIILNEPMQVMTVNLALLEITCVTHL